MTGYRSLLMSAVIVGVTIVGDGSLLSAQVGKGAILIGKYVGAKETARLWRYVVIQ